ncbi:MAG: hypothetical protein H7Y20_02125, partial [Bryobacteraceae bacterium]|nr:hypothetical protein [Bryobacteraceae bacterium]
FYLQHYGALFTRVETNLYMEKYDVAHEELMKQWNEMSQSFILRWQMLNIMAQFLRGRVSLARWLDDRGNRQLKGDIETCIAKLRAIRSTWQAPTVFVLEAGLALGNGDSERAIRLLQNAGTAFSEISVKGFAAACRVIEADLRQDGGGADFASARTFLFRQQVQKPRAFVRMMIPGNWHSQPLDLRAEIEPPTLRR